MRNISSIILAAGASTRMGKIKQLLPWRGKTFLEHAVNASREAGIKNAVVVLGANVEKILPEINRLGMDFVYNQDWELGIGTSIRKGMIQVLTLHPRTHSVLIQLADQPRITQKTIVAILSKKKDSSSLVASRYQESLGVPALFSRNYFSELLAIPNNAGAKSIFLRYSDQITNIITPETTLDIDTPEEYTKLTQ